MRLRYPNNSPQIRITMAAIDPTAAPETDGQGNVPSIPRSTLKIYKANVDEDDEDEEDYLESLLGGGEDDESDEDEEANGGPSDPSKSKKARRDAAIKKLLAATQGDSDDEMEDAGSKPNGAKSKGKGKASDEDEEESDEEDDDAPDFDMEEYVVCTLDTERVRIPFGPSNPLQRLTPVTDLPTTYRHHCRRGREDLLQRQGHSHCVPDWQLRRPPGRGGGR